MIFKFTKKYMGIHKANVSANNKCSLGGMSHNIIGGFSLLRTRNFEKLVMHFIISRSKLCTELNVNQKISYYFQPVNKM